MLRRDCSLRGGGERQKPRGCAEALRPVFPLTRTGVRWGPAAGSPVRRGPWGDTACSARALAPPTWAETPFRNDGRTVALPALAPSRKDRDVEGQARGVGGGTPQPGPRPAGQQLPPGHLLPSRCLHCSGAEASSSRSRGGSGCRSDSRDPGSGRRCCPGTPPLGEGTEGRRLRRSAEASAPGRAFSSRRGVPRWPRVCTGRRPRGHGPAHVRPP